MKKELEEALDGYEEFTDTKKNYNKWLTDLETEKTLTMITVL